MLIGVDYHPSFQQIAFLVEETAEYSERRLNHGEVIMVEVRSKRCLGRTETDREITKRAVVVEAEDKRTTKTTLRSDRRSLLKKYLTGPTLLEMSGYATYRRPPEWVQ